MKTLVTFDLDNTLWDVAPVIMRAEYAMASWFDDRFPGFSRCYSLSVQEAFKKAIVTKNPAISSNLTALRLEVYKRALRQFGLPSEEADAIASAALGHFCEWRQKVDLYPHVVDVLEALSQDYSLAVITNGNADVFHPYVGLGQYFDFAIRADQAGVAKPSVDVFLAAAKTAGVDLSQLIHIGDHPVDDVYGATNAGAKSIWFNRHGAQRWGEDWGNQSNAEVHSLLELPTVIRSLML
ncbi:HAD-IA family hydrolase [Marinomonas sp. M1K-6]|uniref:HAD-IA family hydrolase n=1 Tax=Marinomonas profundi TaxID=2726122 RepID=A0A847RAE1_9GAMM|nr:HAD-IA family hydrolase [Marinomonas profundi]NLQ19006.1 HAD-IA family hydrolase [Marinomonas profundi]UDV02081.1 HAD-IA family hydrolase [Marinomonas profundi]